MTTLAQITREVRANSLAADHKIALSAVADIEDAFTWVRGAMALNPHIAHVVASQRHRVRAAYEQFMKDAEDAP
jgi:5-methylcytosine-specific restriction endonuclease McrBC regulatory subunit McrC